jgi:hypothetical protein
MFAASAACWLLRYDNISSMPQWLSDLFCRFSTGGGTIERELYTNGEPYIFAAKRPAVVNGIGDIFHSGDALQRSLILTPPVIRPEDRRTEEDIWADFEQVAPGVFADLLDLLVEVLRELPNVKLDQPLRMADFCKVGIAVENVIRGADGAKIVTLPKDISFMQVYSENQRLGNRTTVDASAVGPVLLRFIDSTSTLQWGGLVSELYTILTGRLSDNEGQSKYWPSNARSLSVALRRLSPNLRGLGYTVETKDEGDGTHIAICKGSDHHVEPALDFEARKDDLEEDADGTFIN